MANALTSLLSQNFRTVKVPNVRLALYTLSIRSPGFSLLSFFTYTFAISPMSLRKAPVAMSAVYDSSGPASKGGVTRNIDSFGMAPPIFMLEGTTGWDRHNIDGYIFTGQQSVQQLQYLFELYAQLNQAQKNVNNPNLYTLELYDYFNQDYWQVEPIGEMEFRLTAQAPMLTFYSLRLAAIQPVSAPIISDIFADPVQQIFAAGASSAASGLKDAISGILGAY
jgi:hypothetical protein